MRAEVIMPRLPTMTICSSPAARAVRYPREPVAFLD